MTLAFLPSPPTDLAFGPVHLLFLQIIPGNERYGMVPSYQFRILLGDGTDAGGINFRLGDTEHVRICAGHIGYEVDEPFRGHGYAAQACRALAPFIRTVYDTVIITCDPDNPASIRTIENLGAVFVDEVDVPPHDIQYQAGSRRKRRYHWKV